MESAGQTFKLHVTDLNTAMMTMGRQVILAPEDMAPAPPVRLPLLQRRRSLQATQDAQSLVGKREGCPAACLMLQIMLPPCALFGELPSPGGCGARDGQERARPGCLNNQVAEHP